MNVTGISTHLRKIFRIPVTFKTLLPMTLSLKTSRPYIDNAGIHSPRAGS